MFPKPIRLQLRQEKDFFQTAKRKSFPLFQVMYRPAEQTQFAVIVPKKVSASSAKRHKVLRRMRQVLVQNQEKFVNKQVVVVVFYSSLEKSFAELTQAIEKAAVEVASSK